MQYVVTKVGTTRAVQGKHCEALAPLTTIDFYSLLLFLHCQRLWSPTTTCLSLCPLLFYSWYSSYPS